MGTLIVVLVRKMVKICPILSLGQYPFKKYTFGAKKRILVPKDITKEHIVTKCIYVPNST